MKDDVWQEYEVGTVAFIESGLPDLVTEAFCCHALE
jgi:hypothetical protein